MGWINNNMKLTSKEAVLFDSDDVLRDDDGNILIDIAYRRVSTEKQSLEGYGLEMQLEKIQACCRELGTTSCILVTDDGFTGTIMERPGLDCFTERLQNFNKGLTNIRIRRLIIPRMDRLGRTLLGTLQFIQDYIVAKEGAKSDINNNKYLVEFVSCDERFIKIVANQFGEIDATSKLILTMFAMFAEFDRDQIVAKLKTGRELRAQSGYPLGGGNTPFGYRYESKSQGNAGNFVTIPEEKKKVLEARRLFVEEHLPPREIALKLGLTTEKLCVNILKSRTYLNKIIYKGHEYPGHFEAFLTEEQWQEQQEEFARRSKKHATGKYLLTGLMYCGNCGAKMRYQAWGNTVRILCYSQDKSKYKQHCVRDENCPNTEYYFASDIEDSVIKYLFKIAYTINSSNIKTLPDFDVLGTMKRDMEREQRKLQQLLKQFGTVDVSTKSGETIQNFINELSVKIDNLQKRINAEEANHVAEKSVHKIRDTISTLEEVWDELTLEKKKEVCKLIIHKIVITKTDSEPLVEIQLNLDKYLTAE